MRTFAANALFISIAFVIGVLMYALVRIDHKLDAHMAAQDVATEGASCALPQETLSAPTAEMSANPLLAAAQELALIKSALDRHVAFRGDVGDTNDLNGFAFAVRKQQLESTFAGLVTRYNALAARACGTAETISIYANHVRHELACRL